MFCDCLEDNATWNGFSGKTVKLGADISIERAAGNAGHEFMGTFDGDYHTLTVNITETTTQGTAPFREIKGATIKNVITTGNVNGTAHASGLVGFARGDASVTNTIERCKVGANVTVTTADQNGNYHCGGVVGHAIKSNLNISNTVYCGAITNSGNHVGGFQGWCDGNTITLNNCLFAGSYSGGGVFHPVAVRNKNNATTATVTNTFYTVLPTQTDAAYIAADGKKTTGNANIPINLGNQEEEINFMTVYEGGMLYDGLYYAAPAFSVDDDYTYLINNATDWDYFCDALQDNDTWNRFIHTPIKLGNDITVSRVAGSPNHDFCGTFEGNHKTITFNLGTADNPESGISAPFSHTSVDAVINDLTVDGTIYTSNDNSSGFVGRAFANLMIYNCRSHVTIHTSNKFAAGFVSYSNDSTSIINCESSVVIISSVNGDGTHAGFIGRSRGASVNTIDGCVFNGKLLTTNGTTSCGGFIGWYNACANTISSCLYAPAALAEGETAITDGATFVRWNTSDTDHAPTIDGYYIEAMGEAQGKQAFSITGGEDVTVTGIESDGTEYDVSGITAYGDGFMRDSVFYAGEEDEVLLTLTYTGNGVLEGFTASAGTLTGRSNPYWFIMPAEDVVISAIATSVTVPGDVDGDGNVTAGDVTALYNWILNSDDSLIVNGDQDGDGFITSSDVTFVYNILLGSK